MSGTTPPPGSEPGESNPYAQPGDAPTPSQPSAGSPPAWSGPTQEPAWSGPSQEPTPQPPQSILNAVKLMYVGAVMSLLLSLLSLLDRDAIRDALAENDSSLTGSELDTAVNVAIGVSVVVSLLGVLLWLWMASSNKKGKSWARTVATVLGGLNILFTLYSLVGGGSGIGILINVASILLAGVILWLLYRPESGEYYSAVTRARLGQ